MLMFIHICICMNVYTCNDDNKRCHKFGLEGHEELEVERDDME